jgi:hypothetical protein
MLPNQLAELGSWVATHAEILIFGEQEQPQLIATNYWTSSKIRLDRWTTALQMFEKDFEDQRQHNPWPAMEILIQEILSSDLLTRIWSATVLSHDWFHQTDELSGLAHSIHIRHLEAKNRAIRVMIRGRAHDEAAFDRMNNLRRRIERWTDVFLGQLPVLHQAVAFGIDRNRVKDFHEERCGLPNQEDQTKQKILSASFGADLLRNQAKYAANPELNREIGASVLACFPPDRFDSLGLPKSVQMVWLEKSHVDTQLLLDQLVDFENKADQHVV